MKVIVITEPGIVTQEAELIKTILDKGVDRVHIRKPEWCREQIKNLICEIPHHLRSRITLHDNFDLFEDLGVGGLQLNQRNPYIPQLFTGVRSASCHSIDELQDISNFDYVTLSPIFNSISKSGYQSNFSEEELYSARKHNYINDKVIAMGGVTPAQIPYLREIGFGGVALLGYIWGDKSIEGVASRAMEAVKMAKMSRNFSLQYISHRNSTLDDVSSSEAALEGGCRWVQLRMKGFSDEEFISRAKVLRTSCDKVGATFILNDRAHLVKECKADGVHLGREDISPREARILLGSGAIIGGTANSLADIDNLVVQGVDYIGLGPFRFTTTKEKLSPTLGLEGYVTAVEHCHKMGYATPIVAIGGITVDDIYEIMSCRVNGIALSGTILNAEDSVATTSDIMKILRG